jgi:hypothetical protein
MWVIRCLIGTAVLALIPLLSGCGKTDTDGSEEFGPDQMRPAQIQSMREKAGKGKQQGDQDSGKSKTTEEKHP